MVTSVENPRVIKAETMGNLISLTCQVDASGINIKGPHYYQLSDDRESNVQKINLLSLPNIQSFIEITPEDAEEERQWVEIIDYDYGKPTCR